ncbi:MAG: 2-oxoacid:acceptor oxidoreductase family protein [candidate division KSB1 bacterium]|nr:2-oxoacid:acceptor oxidoreductase family protein [candidate division KSB1 bacterium]MDZ7274290.1 2-oxoacid:acceptor oxidoreductase family protein [candidate division KSB1 bacterium]MDZ7287188.1 2-oxoacid:acceptor oxidoreductase family protein [candidate division KSB1 bacterium]MDZ7296887.1 2-oxoacid:acceptor oxidoreductase family protein [candidate division KSB1 bacterium]MDZ7306008.1 2-oxoacid:acceptor oxidoreductase family protein [candidate division KSB1 bacterium]
MEATVLRRPASFYEVFNRKPGAEKTSTHYCPGCGHGTIHKLIAEAMDDFGIADRTVFISPVGCAVFAYYYMKCGNIQVAHGRAPAAATGVRRALPDSIVISYQGDGDLAAIGGNEILHAANRGENITVIFVNNAIYGMTGGQMAPTTLLGMKTTTTPYGRSAGNEGFPLRVCELLSSLEAPAYLERVAVTDAKNVMSARRAIRKAIQYQIEGRGFSLVELLAICPTGWNLTPSAAKKWLVENMLPVFPLGVFRDKKEKPATPPPSNGEWKPAADLRALLDIPQENETVWQAPATGRELSPRMKIAGFGGQGILFAGVTLAEAGMRIGRHVSWLPSYGPEMRGGTANCHVIISNEKIGSPLVSESDVLIAMNRPSLEKFQAEVRPGGLVLYNRSLIAGVTLRDEVQVVAVPATEIADALGNTKVANVVMLGAYLELSKLLPEEVVLAVLNQKAKSRPALAELNARALAAGQNFARTGVLPHHA